MLFTLKIFGKFFDFFKSKLNQIFIPERFLFHFYILTVQKCGNVMFSAFHRYHQYCLKALFSHFKTLQGLGKWWQNQYYTKMSRYLYLPSPHTNNKDKPLCALVQNNNTILYCSYFSGQIGCERKERSWRTGSNRTGNLPYTLHYRKR